MSSHARGADLSTQSAQSAFQDTRGFLPGFFESEKGIMRSDSESSFQRLVSRIGSGLTGEHGTEGTSEVFTRISG